jgi:hypothetical protein
MFFAGCGTLGLWAFGMAIVYGAEPELPPAHR